MFLFSVVCLKKKRIRKWGMGDIVFLTIVCFCVERENAGEEIRAANVKIGRFFEKTLPKFSKTIFI